MPWETPSLRQTRQMVRDDITASTDGAQPVGNKVLRVMADAMAGLARLILKYLDWLALQLIPDTAETEWLDRHGQIWLVNADGSLGRKNATAGQGVISVAGVGGVNVPLGSTVVSPDGQTYETLEWLTLGIDPSNVAVRALTTGAAGNLPSGTELAFTTPISGVSSVTVVDLRGGTDRETDTALRARVLERIRQPPMGGDAEDYVAWALAIPFVTRAWCAPHEMGVGTVTVRFMADALRADVGGFPTEDDINVVRDYLDKKRPVAVKDFFVEAPVPEPIDFGLTLVRDSTTARAQIAAAVSSMLREKSNPAHSEDGKLIGPTTILASWVAEAINRVTNDFQLSMVDHAMPHNGSLAVLGTIGVPPPLSVTLYDTPSTIPPTADEVLFNLLAAGDATLPDTAAWAALHGADELLLKDISGKAWTYPITIHAAGTNLIDGVASIILRNNYGAYRLRPRPDNSMWMIV
jgi:uncharacterized phage protein gp47/JayE